MFNMIINNSLFNLSLNSTDCRLYWTTYICNIICLLYYDCP